jgi:alpha-tubulin suppressor-like RCC1 family protein
MRLGIARLAVLALLGGLLACGPVPVGRDDSSSTQLRGRLPGAQPVPAPVLLVPGRPLVGVVAVAAGLAHGLALRDDGTVWAWGNNSLGQLGDGTTGDHLAPAPVLVAPERPLAGVTAIAARLNHNLALTADGAVWAWGENRRGQVGDGTSTDRSTPVRVSGLEGVVAIAAGPRHSLAVRRDGTVWAWGSNWGGPLGEGTTTDHATPNQVHGLDRVIAVSGGDMHSLALTADGTVWAWGYNRYGQLGDGTTTDRLTPIAVPGLTGATAIAAGLYYSLVLTRDGTVWSFPEAPTDQRGGHTPQPIGSLAGVTALAASHVYSLALGDDGTVRGWGVDNHWGEIGDGTTATRRTPVPVLLGPGQPLAGVRAIAAGDGGMSLALRQDGTVWAWGAADFTGEQRP